MRVTAIHDRCYEEHAARIDAAYQMWVEPQRAAAESAIFDCVEANGLPSPRTETPGEATASDLEAARPVVLACIAEHAAKPIPTGQSKPTRNPIVEREI